MSDLDELFSLLDRDADLAISAKGKDNITLRRKFYPLFTGTAFQVAQFLRDHLSFAEKKKQEHLVTTMTLVLKHTANIEPKDLVTRLNPLGVHVVHSTLEHTRAESATPLISLGHTARFDDKPLTTIFSAPDIRTKFAFVYTSCLGTILNKLGDGFHVEKAYASEMHAAIQQEAYLEIWLEHMHVGYIRRDSDYAHKLLEG